MKGENHFMMHTLKFIKRLISAFGSDKIFEISYSQKFYLHDLTHIQVNQKLFYIFSQNNILTKYVTFSPKTVVGSITLTTKYCLGRVACTVQALRDAPSIYIPLPQTFPSNWSEESCDA